jgi:hypothetical protein
VESDSVPEIAHDVVAVRPQSDNDSCSSERAYTLLDSRLELNKRGCEQDITYRIQYGTGLFDFSWAVDQM